MNQELIDMAIEAKLNLYVNDLTEKQYMEVIEAFAALVAEAAVAAEREQITNLDWTQIMRDGGLVTWGDAGTLADRVIDTIRARGETK
jgi:hypothetical protein